MAGHAAARVATVAGDEFQVEGWNVDNGLPYSSVTSIAQTPDGFLWVGTLHGGLARFDGVRFVTFHPGNTPEMTSMEVQRLLVDAEGTLWVGLVDGTMLSRRGGQFHFERASTLTPESWLGGVLAVRTNEVVLSSLVGWIYRGMREGGTNRWQMLQPPEVIHGAFTCEDREGVIWYRRRGWKLGQVRGSEFVLLAEVAGLQDQEITALARDGAGRIWVGTPKELAVWAGDRFETMTPTNGPATMSVKQMAIGRSGEIWVRTDRGFRKCVNREWRTIVEPTPIGQRADLPPLAMYPDADGGVWLARTGEGLWHLNAEGRLTRIGREQGLPSDLIEAFLQDREGNVWVGLTGSGLASVRRRTFHSVPFGDATPKAVRSICEDEAGNLWLGMADNRVLRVREGKVTELDLPAARLAATPTIVYPGDPGRIWISSVQNGVWLWESNALQRPFPSEDVGTVVRVFFKDRQGRVWIGNEFGLYCWAGGRLKKFTAEDGFTPAFVLSITEDDRGSLWLGTGRGELRRFIDGKFTSFRPPDVIERNGVSGRGGAAAGAPGGLGALSGSEQFWALLPDKDGVLWVGTLGGGLLRFQGGKFTRYTLREGLPNEHVSQILDDAHGQLWLGTRGGIIRVKKQALERIAGGEIEAVPFSSYGRFDGLPTIECSGGLQPACWRGADGRLWFSTLKGAVWVQPDQVPFNPLPPPVVIEGFWVDSEIVHAPESLPGLRPAAKVDMVRPRDAQLRIPAGGHYYEFKFTAPCFTAPDKVRFRWELTGGVRTLAGGGAERAVNFSHLPPGSYGFRVTACNNDGVWNETGARLAFVVLPHFWEIWWFKLLAPAVFLGSIGAVVLRAIRRRHRLQLERLEQQRALERERARIAQDLHDDLGASLTRIRFVGSLAGRPSAPAEEVREHIEQMRAGARNMVIALDEIVWAVNPKNDSLQALVSYLCHYAEEFLRPTGIRCRLDVPDELPERPLASDVRHHLFLAFKEALNNLASHSAATEAQIQLALRGRGIDIMIRDNGRGFNPAGLAVTGGDGLENMRRRLEAAGGQCKVQSAPGLGTTVSLHLPPR